MMKINRLNKNQVKQLFYLVFILLDYPIIFNNSASTSDAFGVAIK